MQYSEYLQLLLKTATGDMDLLKLDIQTMEIKIGKRYCKNTSTHSRIFTTKIRHD